MTEILPKDYKPVLGFFETEEGIKLVKDTFQKCLAKELTLKRVSAPRFLKTGTGLQDDLAGTQKPVSFHVLHEEKPIEIVHSLAKWKRFALGKYGFKPGTGLYTDMDAIRKDEMISPIHSVYVDQWDWERVISPDERTLDFLKLIVEKIYKAFLDTEAGISERFHDLKPRLPEKIHFIHSEDLEERYPDLSSSEREKAAAEKYGAFFLIGIGGKLRSGKAHDLRAADYDDWSTKTAEGRKGLNGDIIIWDDVRRSALELSSMGIRVDPSSMIRQLEEMGLSAEEKLPFHKGVIDGSIPLSIGGGIGQSRICMALLHKAHIGEVQSSVWPKEVEDEFEKRGIPLL